jgi:hypothetical protein
MAIGALTLHAMQMLYRYWKRPSRRVLYSLTSHGPDMAVFPFTLINDRQIASAEILMDTGI